MERSFPQLSRPQRVSLAIAGTVLTIAACIGIGVNAGRIYDRQERLPQLVEKAYKRAQGDLIYRANATYKDDDLEKLAFISGLRQNGVSDAYAIEIRMLRSNAFESSRESRDVASILAIDTRPADGLLLEAVTKLNDADLLSLLRSNSKLFVLQDRSLNPDDPANKDSELVYHKAYFSHTTLSESDRDFLASCFMKLEKMESQTANYDKSLGGRSGSCVPAKKKENKDIFDAKSFINYNYQ